MAAVDFPLQFKRQEAQSLEADFSFANDAAIDSYASTSALTYDGQLVYSRDTQKLFVIYDDGGSFAKKEVGNSILTTDGDGNSYLANDGTYKTVSSGGVTNVSEFSGGTFGAGNYTFPNSLTSNGLLSVNVTDPNTNGLVKVAEFNRLTSGTSENGIGGYVSFGVEDDEGNVGEVGRFDFLEGDALNPTSSNTGFQYKGMVNGSLVNFITTIGSITDLSIPDGSVGLGSNHSFASNQINGIAIGNNATIANSGSQGISIGFNSEVGGIAGVQGIGIGAYSSVSADRGIAIGAHASATAQGAILIGAHTGPQVNSLANSFKLMWGGTTGFHTGLTIGTRIAKNSDPETNLTSAENGSIVYDSDRHLYKAYKNGEWTYFLTASSNVESLTQIGGTITVYSDAGTDRVLSTDVTVMDSNNVIITSIIESTDLSNNTGLKISCVAKLYTYNATTGEIEEASSLTVFTDEDYDDINASEALTREFVSVRNIKKNSTSLIIAVKEPDVGSGTDGGYAEISISGASLAIDTAYASTASHVDYHYLNSSIWTQFASDIRNGSDIRSIGTNSNGEGYHAFTEINGYLVNAYMTAGGNITLQTSELATTDEAFANSTTVGTSTTADGDEHLYSISIESTKNGNVIVYRTATTIKARLFVVNNNGSISFKSSEIDITSGIKGHPYTCSVDDSDTVILTYSEDSSVDAVPHDIRYRILKLDVANGTITVTDAVSLSTDGYYHSAVDSASDDIITAWVEGTSIKANQYEIVVPFTSENPNLIVPSNTNPVGNILNPVENQLVVDTTDNELQLYQNGAWRSLEGGSPAITLDSGSYVPIATNISNTSLSSVSKTVYLRVGNTVHVEGQGSITATSAGLAQIRISLPIPSSLISTNDLSGTGHNTAFDGIYIFANTANNEATIRVDASDTSARSFYFSFSYDVI